MYVFYISENVYAMSVAQYD